MRKSLLSTAIIATMVSSSAIANPTLYGAINLGVSNNTSNEQSSVDSYSSKLGVKGKTKISDSITGIYKVEIGVDIDGDAGSDLTTYNTVVGMETGYGTLMVGKHDTPYKMAGSADVFANTAADSQHNSNGVIGRGGWDKRADNILAYTSPTVSDITIHAAGAVDQNAGASDMFSVKSFAGVYKKEDVKASLAYETDNTSGSSLSAVKLTGQVKDGKTTISGTWESADRFSEKDVKAMLGSVAYQMTSDTTLLGQYGTIDTQINDDLESRLTVGVGHNLAKTTQVYAGINMDNYGTAGDATTYTAGVSHSF